MIVTEMALESTPVTQSIVLYRSLLASSVKIEATLVGLHEIQVCAYGSLGILSLACLLNIIQVAM